MPGYAAQCGALVDVEADYPNTGMMGACRPGKPGLRRGQGPAARDSHPADR